MAGNPPEVPERLALGLVLGEQANDPQQDHCTEQAGEEGEPPATGVSTEDESEDCATDETTDDADNDIQAETHLGVRAHDLGGDPTGESTDYDPTDNAQSGGCTLSENEGVHCVRPFLLRRIQYLRPDISQQAHATAILH